mgnify:CR=1 FL=1
MLYALSNKLDALLNMLDAHRKKLDAHRKKMDALRGWGSGKTDKAHALVYRTTPMEQNTSGIWGR